MDLIAVAPTNGVREAGEQGGDRWIKAFGLGAENLDLGGGAGPLLEAGLCGRRQRGHVRRSELSHGVMVGEVDKLAWRGGVNPGLSPISQKRHRTNR